MTRPEGRGGTPSGFGRRLYATLLMLYPTDFRTRFGPQMEADFDEMRAEVGRLRVWLRLGPDLIRSALRARAGRPRLPAARATNPGGGRGGSARRHRRSGREALLGLVREVRRALRALARNPGYAGTAVATLALAIGANTAVFSLVRAVVLAPLPYPNPDRLVVVDEVRTRDGDPTTVSYPNLVDVQLRTGSFAATAPVAGASYNLSGGSEAARVAAAHVGWEVFDVLGVQPALGRRMEPEDDRPGAGLVAVLDHGFWQRYFGADESIVGRSIRLSGNPATVVGVLPRGVALPIGARDLWLPVRVTNTEWLDRRQVHAFTVLGRLRPGISLETARTELSDLSVQLRAEHPETMAGRGLSLRSLPEAVVGDVRVTLRLLMAAVTLVLIVASANLANLLMARGSAREAEMTVRVSLGARGRDLATTVLSESVVLALVGAGVGIGLAALSLQLAGPLLEDVLPRGGEVRLDSLVLAFGLGIGLLTGVAFGSLPALRAARRSGALPSAHGTAGRLARPGGHRVREALSAAQVAACVVLLVGSGLLVRSLREVTRADPGFDPEGLLSLTVSLSGSDLATTDEVVAFYRQLPDRLRTVPGVEFVSAVNALPISGGDSNGSLTLEGRPFPPDDVPGASFRRVLPGYFQTAGIRLVDGRDFGPEDDGSSMVTIVNEGLARRFWPDGGAVGARIKVGPPEFEPWLTIVGVVADVRNMALDSEPRFATYEPHTQRPWSTMSVVVRSRVDPQTLLPALRREIRAAGGDIPVFDAITLTDRIAASLAPRRLTVSLMLLFGVVALATALVGLYGVLSYTVAQRTPEFGIRMALGADGRRVESLVLRRAGLVLAVGLAIGLGAALMLGRALEALLFRVEPADPVTLLSVSLGVAAVGLLAAWIPARRATRTEPRTTLWAH